MTDIKKFLDPSFPLFDKFREIAPGTLRHCQNVANLCESVAIELGLDVDVMKLSALFHDVGKINNPKFFTENQNGEGNPHDDLDPFVSHAIITRHVGDSILILLQFEDFPREVLEIISQNHGNTVLKIIANKTK